MLTGQADAEMVGHAVNAANLYRYISKPWNETDLFSPLKKPYAVILRIKN